MNLLKVTQEMRRCNPTHPDYPLLVDDVVVRRADGTFAKLAPGLGIEGFRLSDEQAASLEPTTGSIVIGGCL